jgi:hypothetical protein
MLAALSNRQLTLLYQQLDLTRRQYHLLLQSRPPRNKRRERGAWVRPGLSESALALETRLLKSYNNLGSDLLKSLSGPMDDISSGRMLQAKKIGTHRQEEEDALKFFGVDEDEIDQPVDKNRLPALLALLALWKTRHLAISDAAISEEFQRGRTKALAAAKRPNASSQPDTAALEHAVLAKFEGDIDRLEAGLRDGTVRSYGIQWILENSASIGQAAAYTRRLLDAESFRVSMLAEAATWDAFRSGERAGAVEASRSILAALGHPFPQLATDLTDDEKEELPRYAWSGPQDSVTCGPCSGHAGIVVYALSLDALPDPTSICDYGRNCRHSWEIVS